MQSSLPDTHMRTYIIFFLILWLVKPVFSQDAGEFTNATFLKKLKKEKSYSELKTKIVSGFAHSKPGHWGEFVTGVDEVIPTQKKIIAFTFDACGGKNGNLHLMPVVVKMAMDTIKN